MCLHWILAMRHESVRGRRGVAPRILNRDTRLRRMALHSTSIVSKERALGDLGLPQSYCTSFIERKKFFFRTEKQSKISGSSILHAGHYTCWAILAFLKRGDNGICGLLWGTELHILPTHCRPVLHTHSCSTNWLASLTETAAVHCAVRTELLSLYWRWSTLLYACRVCRAVTFIAALILNLGIECNLLVGSTLRPNYPHEGSSVHIK